MLMPTWACCSGAALTEPINDLRWQRCQRSGDIVAIKLKPTKRNDMKLTDVFPSKYIKAEDLQGRDITLTIRECKIEKLDQDQKLVLYFLNKDKGMVCNRTNADRIALIHGGDTDGWIGKQIVIGPELTNNLQGKAVMAIRVKGLPTAAPAPIAAAPVQAAPAAAPAPAPFDDPILF
jgi:hypothetical protein